MDKFINMNSDKPTNERALENVWKKWADKFDKAFCNNLPLALLLHSGDSWVQFCHGGFPLHDLSEQVNQFKAGEDLVMQHDAFENDTEHGLLFSDFDETDHKHSAASTVIKKDEAIHLLQRYGVKALIHGHQHDSYGLKIGGIEWWRDSNNAQLVNHLNNGNRLLLSSIDYPVFTFSTASDTDATGQPYDCFGVVTTADAWNDWSLMPYEFLMGDADRRTGCYMLISGFNPKYVINQQENIGGRAQDIVQFSFHPSVHVSTDDLINELYEKRNTAWGGATGQEQEEKQDDDETITDDGSTGSGK